MALGPSLAPTTIADRSIVGELEAKIDAWLRDSWKPGGDGYVLPFWVFWGNNHTLFVAMLERYRATGWTYVGVETDTDNTNRLLFLK